MPNPVTRPHQPRWPYGSAARLCVLILWAWLAAGCGAQRNDSTRIDAQWHKANLVDGLLVPWLESAPTASGFMRTALDRSWKANAQQPGYLTDQARLVYSLIIGFEVTKDRRYLEAANRGADFLLTRFHDPIDGGFFLRVAEDGKVIAASKNTYAHAFALLALAHMFRVTREERYGKAALATWSMINLSLRDNQGGFWGELPRNFSQAGAAGSAGARSQNPLMHMFEALLALHDATQDPAALRGAKSIGDFVVYRLMQGTADGGAYVPEWYDHRWQPLPTKEKGGYTDIGHQFEWYHLLQDAEQRGLTGVYAQAAERILMYAVKVGYDEVDGGAFTRAYPDGAIDKSKYWWQQTEAMCAFLMSATLGGKGDMWRRYEQTLGLVQEQFIDKENRGWFYKPRKDCARGGCPPEQIEPYHMTAMHQAALELAARKK